MIKVWCMFLISICMMARAADITQYCPCYEDIELPEGQHLWNLDGIPDWIELGLRDWKCRQKSNKGKRYGIRVHRNFLDVRFCPVHWLLVYLHYHNIAGSPQYKDPNTGKLLGRPLFQRETNDPKTREHVPTGHPMIPADWTHLTDRLWWTVGPGLGNSPSDRYCTNHSIRRSAAQWAGRCYAGEIAVRNNGRWRSMEILAIYMGQGHAAAAGARDQAGNGDGDVPAWDPIEAIWYFQPVTVGGASGLDCM
jgi:hypothetical protein